MKCITLWQPWASLIAHGLKQYETRDWYTWYRGPLLIHAAKRKVKREEVLPILYSTGGGGVPQEQLDLLNQVCDSDLPMGAIVAVVNMADCLEMVQRTTDSPDKVQKSIAISQQSVLERAVGCWQRGRFAWKFDNVCVLPEPIPAKGEQKLWTPSDEILQQLQEFI